ncbi:MULTISPECIES: hypothetical protein [Vibrio]|uniref:hypothetical protein n=1 Tax=Vibrio TaxID=662 RepID=UPI001CDBFE5E|nr:MULTISPECIES: hypothetical protein [Vibrio]MCA2438573.1 hypothetical protein [Vibrio alginolyticus]MDW1729487.1 hypothetical protein [Vibrio sp. Vb2356]MDW1931167.1 hypothetical protein [Vibrio sp. 970]
MKYEDLLNISNALISANDKAIFLNVVIALLAIIAIYYSSKWKKSGELDAIKSGFEEIRNQNKAITTDTEDIKRHIEKGTIEFQIKLSKFHDRKIEAIDIVYQHLSVIYRTSTKMLLTTEETQFGDFYEKVEKFRDVLESNKIWLSSELCESIENFAITIDMQVRRYQGALNVARMPGLKQSNIEKVFDKQEDFYDFCVSKSSELKGTLEDELRKYVAP